MNYVNLSINLMIVIVYSSVFGFNRKSFLKKMIMRPSVLTLRLTFDP